MSPQLDTASTLQVSLCGFSCHEEIACGLPVLLSVVHDTAGWLTDDLSEHNAGCGTLQ
jgi:hypothetical protein